MKKISKKMKKTLTCCSVVGSLMAFSPLIIQSNTSINTSLQQESLITSNNLMSTNLTTRNEATTTNPTSDQTNQPYIERFKIKTSADATTEAEKQQIDSIYSGKQSDVNVGYGTDQQLGNANNLPYNGLLNLFSFTDQVVGITGDVSTRPKIEILSKADKEKNENVTTNLNAFNKMGNTDVSENLLNSLGILYVKVTTYNRTSQTISYTDYIMLSGFGSSLSSSSSSGVLTPSGEEFKKKVPDLSDNDLANYPTFDTDFKNQDTINNVVAQTDPQVREVMNRQDYARNGSVKYTVNFDWEVNQNIYNSAKAINNGASTSSSTSFLNREMSKDFSISGFQPSSNVTTRETVIIVASIIAAGVIISALLYVVSLFTRKIRNAKKM